MEFGRDEERERMKRMSEIVLLSLFPTLFTKDVLQKKPYLSPSKQSSKW